MAQGGLKKKSEKFNIASKKSKKSSKRSKPLGPRKGGHYIAPRKSAKSKAEKLKKQLEKHIGRRIEQEATLRASKAGTEFRILSTPSDQQASNSGKKK